MLKKRRTVFLFQQVDEFSAQDVIDRLLELDNESKEPINLLISSPGGIVSFGFGIIDVMEQIESPVNTVVLGNAASAAALIAAAGEKRLISENSRFMLHQVSAGTWGRLSDMQKNLLTFEQTNEKMFQMMAKFTGKTLDQIKDKVGDDDVWFSANQAIEFGLADEVMTTEKINTFKLSESLNVGITNFSMGEKLADVELLKVGQFYDDRNGDFEITISMLEAFKANFESNVTKIDTCFNITHENDDGEKEAVGWVKSMEIKNDVLIAFVDFNKKGRELLSEKSFKYASAEYVYVYNDEDGKPHSYVILGATLTNRPVIKNNPIKLSEKSKERKVKSMDKDQMILNLKSFGIDVVSLENVNAKYVTLTEENSTLKTENAKYKADSEELASIKEQSIVDAKDVAFEKLVAEKKELPARKELVLGHYKTAKDLEKAYEGMPAMLHTEAIGDDGSNNTSGELTKEEQALVDSKEFTREEVLSSRRFAA